MYASPLSVVLFALCTGLAPAPTATSALEPLGLSALPRSAHISPGHLSPVHAAPDGQDDETVADFKKFYRKFKETDDRVEAILALGGVESPAVVDVLLPLFKSDEDEVHDAAVRILGAFKERPPVDRLFEKLEKEKRSELRAGILRAVMRGGYRDSGETLLDCLGDKDWNVRRLASGAVAAGGNGEHAPLLLPLCADKEVAVRCAAFDGLALLRSDLVRVPAVRALGDSAWQVRASAIHALGKVRHRDSIGPLIKAMAVEEGRLRADVATALQNLTGKTTGQRLDLWERFWESAKDRYEIPTDADLAKLRAKQAEYAAVYKPVGNVAFHGIDTPSRRVLFVIDVSGSMENEVVEKDRFRDGEYPSYSRIDIVKTELARTIESLESYVEFNILAFATEVRSWKKKLTKANVLGKASAMDFARKLEPLGGSSSQDLAAAGLVMAANLGAGKTNTYGALAAALELETRREDDYELELDTIFFLSDGKPTCGRFTDRDEILAQIRKGNELRRVVIHTIALGQFEKEFMRRLAVENGGVFVDLGK